MNTKYKKNQEYFNSQYQVQRDRLLSADSRELPLDENTKAMADGIYDGSLASSLKNNMKYAMGGVFIGAIGGFLLATLLRQNRLVFGLAGAVIAGAGGYLLSPNDKKLK